MYEFDADWLAKLEELRSQGIEPYPAGLEVTHTSTEIFAEYGNDEFPDEGTNPDAPSFAVGGRLMFRNRMGKAMFLRIQDRGEPTVDGTDKDGNPVKLGGKLQLYLRREEVGDEVFNQLKKLDIGDFVHARGRLMRTRTQELTLRCFEVTLAAKVMTPFPDRFHSVTDVETRSRQRYVDLFMNDDARQTFRLRSRIVSYIRRFFEDREYLEVETPILQAIPGGAAARPFETHHNALDMGLYMRIAPELYLKRLVVGGFERVFELNRNFRNEGVSLQHNPEFTMLEWYQAWATYEDNIALTEELLSGLAQHVLGTTDVPYGDAVLDFSAPFARKDMDQAISEATGLSLEALRDATAMEAFWRSEQRVGEDEELPSTMGKWWEYLFDEYVEKSLQNPTFITGFPTEISPLARRSDGDPLRTDRFEVFAAGRELGNGFTELNDPVDQAGRFEAQVAAREAGDDESMYFDHDYVRALTYGMPPTSGEGIGIDRLVMLLTNKASIREVILFPTLRPRDPST